MPDSIRSLGEKIGVGRTAEVFEYGTGSVLKLYYEKFGNRLANLEYEKHKAVQGCGLPVPQLYDVLETQGRTGLVYQRIHGKSMLAHMMQSPLKTRKYARDMADLHFEVGQRSSGKELEEYKQKIKDSLVNQPMLTEQNKEVVLTHLKSLPDENRLCHMDFHPDNILIENGKYWIIDWMNACSASFEADVARTRIMLEHSTSASSSKAEILLSSAFGNYFCRQYLKRLYDLGINKDLIREWIIPVAAARLSEGIPQNEKESVLKSIACLLN